MLNKVGRLGKRGSGSFLAGIVDDSHTGLVGYSMGGYGVVNVVGGGFTAESASLQTAPPNQLLSARGAANADYRRSLDPRIKAAIAVAPWGMVGGFWDADTLKGISTPILFVAGSADTVAGYEKGTRAIYTAATNADRYLLTFQNASHNAAAPMPPPVETYDHPAVYGHYADAVWDTTRMNNILAHFATAYFDWHLKDDREKKAYFDAAPTLKGFTPRTWVGLVLEHLPASAPAR